MTVAANFSVPPTCQACKSRYDGICAALSVEDLVNFSSHTRHTLHEAGDVISMESMQSNGLANVTEGVIKLSRVLSDGRQQVVGLQFAPDLVGRLFADENPVTAEAASHVELCRVPRGVLETLVKTSGDLRQRMLEQSLQDLDDAREWMITLGRKDARERVASLLLLIANRTAGDAHKDGSYVFDLPIGRADMADFLGLTIETVSRQVTKMRNDGIIVISSHRHVVVPDIARLRAIC